MKNTKHVHQKTYPSVRTIFLNRRKIPEVNCEGCFKDTRFRCCFISVKGHAKL